MARAQGSKPRCPHTCTEVASPHQEIQLRPQRSQTHPGALEAGLRLLSLPATPDILSVSEEESDLGIGSAPCQYLCEVPTPAEPS